SPVRRNWPQHVTRDPGASNELAVLVSERRHAIQGWGCAAPRSGHGNASNGHAARHLWLVAEEASLPGGPVSVVSARGRPADMNPAPGAGHDCPTGPAGGWEVRRCRILDGGGRGAGW